jgi:small subunit ribosomal protein S20
MPNTKSAERRVRNSARKHLRNQGVKSRLHTLQRNYEDLLGAGKPDDAGKALRTLTSALDKAAKRGVIHKSRANRSKSRLSLRLHAANKPASAKPADATPSPG